MLKHTITFLTFFLLNHTAYAQYKGHNEPDSAATSLVNKLRAGGVDTICTYSAYFIGGHKRIRYDKKGRRIITDQEDECDYLYFYKPVYIIWIKDGKTFITKRDNCFEYTIAKLKNSSFKTFFDNQQQIKTEYVRPFQIKDIRNGKEEILTSYVDHAGHQNFTFIVGKDSVTILFDSYCLKETNGDDTNINYQHNNSLKVKQFADELGAITYKVKKRKLLAKITP